ncbi:phosphate/phosphite/phosphonate ABC transporter substrate-binding protein [Lactococcus insecticola]|uniref:Phosphonate ABC transporter substrate-binding protein n=1 Tax=Pseudolactococcus insecticola TaxID=2709158 RepID=A0A6A0B6F0_9LACT|nr:PhnD/SsuA/transferrin family substrate-binding protein [Lactococcus insecticola]GFH40101.1 phosphonate ABC transporter substrate-binding protein [Lactococcus insecticola]
MKKGLKRVLATTGVALFGVAALAACGNKSDASKSDSKTIDDLKISFVPSKNPDDITTATKPLESVLKTELKKQGYTVKKVDVTIGTNFEAVGEALASGSADVGYGVPGSTYAMYKDDTDVILTATRAGLNKDSSNAKDWNDGKPTEPTTKQVTSYRSILVTGPSAKGQALAKKINAGEKLTWDDLKDANWGLSSTTSAAGYVYPSLWLNKNFKHNVTDLTHTVTIDSYGSGLARLASGQIDVLPMYADARRDFADAWTTTYGQKESIWAETNVIGVTPAIYNDAILVSKESKIMTSDFKKALATSIKNLAKTDEGKKIIAVYSHEGYKDAKESDYKAEFAAEKLMQDNK